MTQNRRYQEHYAQMRERIFSEMPAAPASVSREAAVVGPNETAALRPAKRLRRAARLEG